MPLPNSVTCVLPADTGDVCFVASICSHGGVVGDDGPQSWNDLNPVPHWTEQRWHQWVASELWRAYIHIRMHPWTPIHWTQNIPKNISSNWKKSIKLKMAERKPLTCAMMMIWDFKPDFGVGSLSHPTILVLANWKQLSRPFPLVALPSPMLLSPLQLQLQLHQPATSKVHHNMAPGKCYKNRLGSLCTCLAFGFLRFDIIMGVCVCVASGVHTIWNQYHVASNSSVASSKKIPTKRSNQAVHPFRCHLPHLV